MREGYEVPVNSLNTLLAPATQDPSNYALHPIPLDPLLPRLDIRSSEGVLVVTRGETDSWGAEPAPTGELSAYGAAAELVLLWSGISAPLEGRLLRVGPRVVEIRTVAPLEEIERAHSTVCALMQQEFRLSGGTYNGQEAVIRIRDFLMGKIASSVQSHHDQIVCEVYEALSSPAPLRSTRILLNLAKWREILSQLSGRAKDANLIAIDITANTLIQEMATLMSSLQLSGLAWLTSELESDNARKAAQLDARQRASDRISRFFAQFAASALLPSLWLSYWGSSVAPGPSKTWATAEIVVVALALGALGVGLGSLAWRRVVRSEMTDAPD